MGGGQPPPTPPPPFFGLWASLIGLEGRVSVSEKVPRKGVGFILEMLIKEKLLQYIEVEGKKELWGCWGQNANIRGSILVFRNVGK